jgi:CelD/BcsL family acetyltransferase involved in cellulose biosynthesis
MPWDASTDAPRVRVQLVTSPQEFAALRTPWEQLLADGAEGSIFTTWEWQYHWWEHYGKGRPLRLLVAIADGAIRGILPLYVGTERIAGLAVRKLRLVGTGGDTSPEYLGPLLHPRVGPAVARTLVDFVLGKLDGWDVLQLTDLAPSHAFCAELAEGCRRRGLAMRQGVSAQMRYIELPGSWEDYLAHLSHKQRKNARRQRRLFEQQPEARFFLWTDEDRLDAGIQRLIELHHLRWEGSTSGSIVQ